ncbi:hypothetical protein EJ08DRAFT_642382 [Tothia fuscella]|uniref:Protein PNS1 n=1 Tax=Tothia fuscella TaxID=1048955 RepID=A0A9P4NGE8_9PEZI|nr:hypothetical protein EJ08DRAFT_642382 [Tothia fuscella]
MFSEYASRFLAQSQSRLYPNQQQQQNQDNGSNNTTSPNDQRRYQRGSSRLGSRHLNRPQMPNPYQPGGSQVSRFPFASRNPLPSAPLFFSATDEFRDTDDVEEHEREVADLYALQKSRRHFGASRLSESSEVDEEERSGNADDEDEEGRNTLNRPYTAGRGIHSSWRGEKRNTRGRPPAIQESVVENTHREGSVADSAATSTTTSRKGKERLVDVDLSSSERSSIDAMEREEAETEDELPPPRQEFRNPPRGGISRKNEWMPEETDEETARLNPRPPSTDRESVPPEVTGDAVEVLRHDPFWATFFWINLAALFATTLLVYLNTDVPTGKKPLGDTVYTVLQKSYHLLAVDTVVALFVAALWLALLRSFIKPLTYLILIAVPIILFSFSLYPFISSYKYSWHGQRFQDTLMRTFSLVPFASACFWVYLTISARHHIARAMDILSFSCRVLDASPALHLVGAASLAAHVIGFWVWLLMVSRVFLEGHWSKGKKDLYIIDVSTWWLGVYYVLMLLWSQSIISAIQRAISGAATSQWYFHRNAIPAPSSRQVVLASFHHAAGTLFGTICLSTFLTVAIRLPLLILPRRIVGITSVFFYSFVPSPIASLTNPLTLTYAAIHSQPLSQSARGIGNLTFISRLEVTTTLTPSSLRATPGHGHNGDALIAYRTAKLLLHSTRWIMTFALGIGGWVSTARSLHLVEGYSGSLYAYIVGLGAGVIGWGVLGATEGVVLHVLDGLVVCWGSEVGAEGGGSVRYCREAGELFGEKERFGGVRV